MVLVISYWRNTKSLALILLALSAGSASAQELIGAKQALRQYLAAKGRPAPGELTVVELADLLRTMEPKAAGERWAATYLRNRQRVAEQQSYSSLLDFDDDLAALPAPETWPAIDAWFQTNQSPIPYQLLGSYLVGDRDRQRKLIFQFAAQKPQSQQIWDLMLEFGVAWRDKYMVRTAVEQQIAQINDSIANERKYNWPYWATLRLPELSENFDSQFATEIIKNSLEKTREIVLVSGQKDFDIAVALARKDAKKYPIARYELIQNAGSGDLYPLLEKWFPKADSVNKQRALAFYTQSKILKGEKGIVWSNLDVLNFDGHSIRYRTAIVRDVRNDYAEAIVKPSIALKILPLVKQALTKDPDTKELRLAMDLSATVGKQQEMLPLLRRLLTLKRTEDNQDLLESAASLVRTLESPSQTDAQVANMALLHLKNGYGDATQCIEIGKLLGRQDLIVAAKKKQGNETLASLFELKKYRQLEQLAIKAERDEGAKTLLRVYNQLGRHQDVIDLLDKFPNWEDDDLIGVNDYISGGPEINVCYEAGRAFIAAGNSEVGLPILRHSLKSSNQIGEAYDFFVKILGNDAALKELDDLFAADPIDPNPLIWKGKIYLWQGRVKEAEQVTLKAIAIRGFDGDGMVEMDVEAQRLLGSVFTVKGSKRESLKQKSVLEAVRLVALGDKYCDAGLNSRGVRYFKNATITDPNSFSAHIRLAIELYDLGKFEESKPYYRRAFELLPSSYGVIGEPSYRIESRLFDNSIAKSIAQEVLGAMQNREPRNSRVLYQLGNLKFLQREFSAGTQLLLKAIEIDPSYIAAYTELSGITDETLLTTAQQEEIELGLLKLDPKGHNQTYFSYYERILEPKRFYLANQRANEIRYQYDSLYRLAATAKRKLQRGRTSDSPSERTPGKKLMDSLLMRQIKSLVDEKDSDNE